MGSGSQASTLILRCCLPDAVWEAKRPPAYEIRARFQ